MKTRTPHRGLTLLQGVVVLAIVGILAAFLLPLFGRSREFGDHPSSCMQNLKQIDLGFKQYIQDYDEKYPSLATANPEFGWAGALYPYLKSRQIFQCPVEATPPNAIPPNEANPSQTGYTDYWFNARMAGKKEALLDAEALTIALADGDSHNARYGLAAIPDSWRGNTSSPLYRHLEGANYAFADGHAKWFRNDTWKDSLDMRNGSTFRLKPLNQEVRR